MFAADDEDGDFLSPSGGAKLASLFGLDQATSHGNESFQYTAPKQPRKSSANSGSSAQKAAPPPGSPAVLFATAVHAYRYINGQYVKQGKLGAAVLGNHSSMEYKLLLYVSQQKQVTAAKIHSAFIFTVQPSNYCTFYDDQRQNWSLMFESEKIATDFCKEVCLAKANCTSPLEALVTQDLILGDGQGVENGDSLEVAYTGWLLQNHTIGQMFDSNLNRDKLLRLKLGAGKVIKGWDEGMLNMRKGGRRLMVIPPVLAYGAQGVPGRVPADSTLVFDVEIRRVKFAKDIGNDRMSLTSRDSAAPSPAPSVDSLGPEVLSVTTNKPSDPPLRAKSNSLSEQLSNPDATKAKLISRMAKMGQPMLPFITGPASSPLQAESSDSELEDPSVSRRKDHPTVPSPQPVPMSSAPSSLHATALMPVSMTTVSSQPVMPATVHGFQPYSYSQPTSASAQLQPAGQMFPFHTVPYQGSGEITSFLMTEARQHNTEIRLAVSKVGDKVDQLTAKVEDLQKQGGLSLGLSNVSMETAMIMHNIQRIIQENECLKKEVFEKSSRIEEQNRKIGELINQNQRCMEQSNLLMEQRNDSLKNKSEQNQARILQAEQDKARLTEELASSTARISELQLELSAQRQKCAALQTNLTAAAQDGQQHGAQVTALESQLQEMKEAAEQAQTRYKAEKQKRKEAELKLSNLEEELQDLRSEKESVEKTLTDRKRKWQAERQRCDEELEEVRKLNQLEMDNLRTQLRKARTSTDHAAAEQLAQLQADVESEWKVKCEQLVSTAREQHHRETTELTEQRDTLQLKLTQLQEKFFALKQHKEEEEQRLLQQQEQGEEFQALKDKCAVLEQSVELLKQQGQERVRELERRLSDQQQNVDSAGEVKRVMNGVFQSLRGEFELHETYTGSVVLGVLVNTIKNVTLQLLSKSEPPAKEKEDDDEKQEEEEEEEEYNSEPQPQQETQRVDLQLNEKKDNEEKVQNDIQRQQTEESNEDKEKVEERSSDTEQKEEQEVDNRMEEEIQRSELESCEVEVSESQQKEEEEVKVDVGREDEVNEKFQDARDGQLEHESETQAVHAENEATPSEEDTPTEEVTPAENEATPTEEVMSTEEVTPTAEMAAGKVSDSTAEEKEPTRKLITVESDPEENDPVGPPKNPPPPPITVQEEGPESVAQSSSRPEMVEENHSDEPFFQSPVPSKPPPPTSEEEEEELSLKGRPPPTPLFGDDSEEDDLDWLS